MKMSYFKLLAEKWQIKESSGQYMARKCQYKDGRQAKIMLY